MLSTLLASASLAVATPVVVPPTITYDNERTNTQSPYVLQVLCDKASGSAVRVGPSKFITAAHVVSTKNGACRINANPVTVIEFNEALDYAIIEAGPPVHEFTKISCEGFNSSEWYWSTGYAFALPYQTSVAIYSSAFGDKDTGLHIFTGKHTVIPGMSGGMVARGDGALVGIVNAYLPFPYSLYNLSYSRSLKDTSLCNGRSQGNARAPSVATRL
jgi:hypothetical protein